MPYLLYNVLYIHSLGGTELWTLTHTCHFGHCYVHYNTSAITAEVLHHSLGVATLQPSLVFHL